MPSWRAADDVAIDLGGFVYRIAAPIVIEGPAPFEAWGVGGFIAPQELHPWATIELDLRDARLRIVESALDELAPQITARHPELTLVSLPRTTAEGDASRLVLVRARLDGHAPRTLMLNTGGSHVELALEVAGALETQPASMTGRGVSGAPVLGTRRTAPSCSTVSGTSVPLGDVVVRAQTESYQGQIGMSSLRGTVLLWSGRDALVRWWVPDASRDVGAQCAADRRGLAGPAGVTPAHRSNAR